jgi:hypothetical protein
MIDGLWDEPIEWPQLRLELLRAFPGVTLFNVSHEKIKYQSWAKEEDQEGIVIGHSLGAYEAANASFEMKPRLLIGLDPVRPWGLKMLKPLKHASLRGISLRRSKWKGPPGCDYAIAQKDIVPNSDHNSIIAKATPKILELIGGYW